MAAEADDGELRALFEGDQADRRGGVLADELMERDARRRGRVDELLTEGRARTGNDLFAAAMVFQHGVTRDSYLRAHELAKQAVELGCERAKWLVAASLDRWLMHGDQPQRFGTQYRPEEGRWVLWPVDPSTTDEERAALNVAPLEKALARAEDMTRRSPPVWRRHADGVVRQEWPAFKGRPGSVPPPG
jgi:hypothetical protein